MSKRAENGSFNMDLLLRQSAKEVTPKLRQEAQRQAHFRLPAVLSAVREGCAPRRTLVPGGRRMLSSAVTLAAAAAFVFIMLPRRPDPVEQTVEAESDLSAAYAGFVEEWAEIGTDYAFQWPADEQPGGEIDADSADAFAAAAGESGVLSDLVQFDDDINNLDPEDDTYETENDDYA